MASLADGITTDIVKEYINNQKAEFEITGGCVQSRLFDGEIH